MGGHPESATAEPSATDLQGELDRLAAENDRLNSKLRIRSKARSFLTGALIVLTSLLLVASTVGVWGKRTVFDTDRFMGVVDPALDNPAFYDSLSRNVSEQVLLALDLETRVRERLTQLDEYLAVALVEAVDIPDAARVALSLLDRPSLADLTPSIVDPLEQRVTNGIDRFITSEDFQTRLPLLVRRAHEAGLALINDDLADFPNVYIEDGDVRLNLIPIIVEALEPVIDTLTGYLPDVSLPGVVSDRVDEGRTQLREALGAQLPDDFGQLTVVSEEQLDSVQQIARQINRGTWLLVIVTAVFVGLTLLVARRRGRALVGLAVGTLVALAVSWWIIARIRQSVLDKIAEPDSRAAISSLVGELRGSFRTYVLVVLGVAVLVALAALVSAHLDDLARARRWAVQQTSGPTEFNASVTARYDLLRVVGLAVAAVALLWVGISLASLIVIGALLGLYLLALSAVRRDEPVLDVAEPG